MWQIKAEEHCSYSLWHSMQLYWVNRELKVSLGSAPVPPASFFFSSVFPLFSPYHPVLFSHSYTCYSPFFVLSFPHSSTLDVVARWSSNGVYRESAFTTSEANRQVSSAFCTLRASLSLSASPSFPLCSFLLPPFPTASSTEALSSAPVSHASQA